MNWGKSLVRRITLLCIVSNLDSSSDIPINWWSICCVFCIPIGVLRYGTWLSRFCRFCDDWRFFCYCFFFTFYFDDLWLSCCSNCCSIFLFKFFHCSRSSFLRSGTGYWDKFWITRLKVIKLCFDCSNMIASGELEWMRGDSSLRGTGCNRTRPVNCMKQGCGAELIRKAMMVLLNALTE